MSVLPADVLSGLRAGLSAGLNAQTVQYKVMTNGTPGTPVNLAALITVRTRTEAMDEGGRKMQVADIINVRPMEDDTLVLGDLITYSGADYTIRETSGTDVRRLTAALVDTKALQRTSRFRAESG